MFIDHFLDYCNLELFAVEVYICLPLYKCKSLYCNLELFAVKAYICLPLYKSKSLAPTYCSELLTGVVPYTDLRAEAQVSILYLHAVCYLF